MGRGPCLMRRGGVGDRLGQLQPGVDLSRTDPARPRSLALCHSQSFIVHHPCPCWSRCVRYSPVAGMDNPAAAAHQSGHGTPPLTRVILMSRRGRAERPLPSALALAQAACQCPSVIDALPEENEAAGAPGSDVASYALALAVRWRDAGRALRPVGRAGQIKTPRLDPSKNQGQRTGARAKAAAHHSSCIHRTRRRTGRRHRWATC